MLLTLLLRHPLFLEDALVLFPSKQKKIHTQFIVCNIFRFRGEIELVLPFLPCRMQTTERTAEAAGPGEAGMAMVLILS
jgi:hypothetical protein